MECVPSCKQSKELQKSRWVLFGAFATLCCLTQIPYSQEYVDLRQTAHLGKIIQKSPEPGLLHLPLEKMRTLFCQQWISFSLIREVEIDNLELSKKL